MPRLEFRVLGPLSVRIDGADVALGGPKQRALLALLLLSANRVVARDRLVTELFVEQSVNSADHALRNHVSRVRKLLAPLAEDEPRLVARPPGYLLRVEPDELDLDVFEARVAAGRAALAAGDAPTAHENLAAALALWRGRPLADLEFEPFARFEVERLEELRLSVVEERAEAELVLGNHAALVPQLEALVGEHPYRERFRAQLMLALYRSGRQADGLDVYRRTRALLSDELGLEPSVELQELERAILVQDPALRPPSRAVGRATRARAGECPYKGLAPFEPEDADLFFGRERLVEELTARLEEAPLVAIAGASGSGKSSLLRAGLLPALRRPFAVVRPADGVSAVQAAFSAGGGAERVVAVDQFEEVFADGVGEEERRALVGAVVEAAWDPDRRAGVLLGMRSDFFGRVAQYRELADLASNHVLLGPMSRNELRRAIRGPAEKVGLGVDAELVDALVDDVAGEAGGLPLLSTALEDLWRSREDERLTVDAYVRTGGVQAVVERHAEAVYRALEPDDQAVARRILLRLVDGGGDDPPTRRRVPRAELGSDERTSRVLATLVERRLIVADDEAVELVHEALLERWPRLGHWLDDEAQGRRLHAQIAGAAAAWVADDRSRDGLYRGARLAAATDWADATESELTPIERGFLVASRAEHARVTRRLRAFLVAAVVLLVVAAVAAAVALRSRASANREATAAIAQRLGAQALSEPRLDRALLLAREAVAVDDTEATRSNLLATLLRAPAAVAILHPDGTHVIDDAISADGRLLAVRGDNGTVSIFRTRDGRLVRRWRGSANITNFGAIGTPVHALAFSPDARTLAVGDSDGHASTLALVDVTSGNTRRIRSHEAATDDVAYAPDGRTLVTGEITSGRFSPPPEVLVARRPRDGAPLARSAAFRGRRLVGFALGGRDVVVTDGRRRSLLLDRRTLAAVRSYAVGGVGAVSDEGDRAAFGRDDGSIAVVSLASGRIRVLDGRVPAAVNTVAFSPDAWTIASASDDGTVGVWSLKTSTLRESYRGSTGPARDVAFAADGSTLYSGAADGTVVVWDVAGSRRLGRPFRFSPGGGAAAVAASPDSSSFVTSPGANRVTIWRARDLRRVAGLRGPCGQVVSLIWSHDGRFVACTGDGPHSVVWNVRTRRIVDLFPSGGSDSGDGVNFSPDDRLLAVVGSDGHIRVYDIQTRAHVADVPGSTTLQDVDFSSDGTRLAAAGLGGFVAIWDVPHRTLERKVGHGSLLLGIRFSPDGRQIATGDYTGLVHFFDADSGREETPLRTETAFVSSVTYSPDGSQLLTTGGDASLRLWDLASRKLVGAPLPGGSSPGWGTYFPDGRHVVSVDDSGLGVVWDVSPADWESAACRIANRNVTRAEWHDFLPDRGYRRICP